LGNATYVEVKAVPTDKILNKPLWDYPVQGPGALATVGAALANKNNPSRMVMFLDPRLNVKSIGEISPNIDSLKFAEEVRKYAKATGATAAVAYGSFGSDAPILERLVREGILVDAYVVGIGGLRDAMMSPPSLLKIPDIVEAEDQVVRNAGEKLLFSPNVQTDLGQKQIDSPSQLGYSKSASAGEADIYGTRPEQRGDRGGRILRGSYTPLEGAPTIAGATGPTPGLVEAARSYAAASGIPHKRQAVYVEVDEARARRIAAAYEEMKHAPRDPKVQEAYADMIRQTKDQYQALVDAGYEFSFFDSASDPYAGNPTAAMRDLRTNKRMAVYGTYDGYGTEGVTGAAIEDNPMLEPTGLTWPDQRGVMRPVLANDLFRAVHDAFGHGLEGAGFRARGEENAWQAHIRLFTGPAKGAVTSETRGQNSWLNFGPHGDRNRTAKLEDTVFSEQKTGLMPEWTWNEGVSPDEESRYSPAVTPDRQYITRVPGTTVKAEKLELPAIDKEIKELTDSLATAATPAEKKAIRSQIKDLTASKKDVVPKVSYTILKQAKGLQKSLQKNALAGAKNMAKQVTMQAEYFGRLDAAVEQVKQDPARFVDPKGYVEFMRTAGVHGSVLMPPPGAAVLLNNPQQYVSYVNGEYHGSKTKPGTIAAAMSGLDSTVAMRQAIQNRTPEASGFIAPPPMVVALHHFWGILSRQLPPIHQEAAWLRLASQPAVLEHIQKSIKGTLGPDFTQEKWDAIVDAAFKTTAQPGNLLGNQGKSNANAFYLMLTKWNGAWDKVSEVYATPSSREMGRRFWALNRGASGIKNKVQRFIGLTFGIPGLIMDRWKFVEFFMGQFGKSPQDYFKYTSTGTPEDVAGIYGGYGPIENGDPNFSLAFYEGMETVLQAAIDNSPDLKNLLGKHPNVGGLHWVGWNAIKNEAVGHSSLDLTFDLLKNPDINPASVLEQVRAKEYYTEGLDGNTLKRFTLKP
jgi:hypothetical protein